VTSNRDRQRAAARARLEREMADRAERSASRRRRNTTIAATAGGLVVLLGVAWLVVVLTKGDKKAEPSAASSASAAPTSCTWLPLVDPSTSPAPEIPKEVKDVGTPPASGEPRTGSQTMTMDTSVGTIKIKVDTANAPCAAASFTYLAGKKFFDGSKCHRLVTQSIYVLQCGDPSGTSKGGPTYRYAEENLPTGRRPAYTEGMVAIAKTQNPASSGSQFFIVYKDIETLSADYTVLGRVTEGLDLVKKVAEAGTLPDPEASGDPAAANSGDGPPKTEVKVNSLTMSPAS
jgi:peptidyl-prolyl cis-trans isomerase B (cyclophilin B)